MKTTSGRPGVGVLFRRSHVQLFPGHSAPLTGELMWPALQTCVRRLLPVMSGRIPGTHRGGEMNGGGAGRAGNGKFVQRPPAHLCRSMSDIRCEAKNGKCPLLMILGSAVPC